MSMRAVKVLTLLLGVFTTLAAFGLDVLSRDRRVRKYLSKNEIDACFDIKYYIKHRDYIFKRVGIK